MSADAHYVSVLINVPDVCFVSRHTRAWNVIHFIWSLFKENYCTLTWYLETWNLIFFVFSFQNQRDFSRCNYCVITRM